MTRSTRKMSFAQSRSTYRAQSPSLFLQACSAARLFLRGGGVTISRAAFGVMCIRSTTLRGFYKHGHLGTLPFLFGILSKAFWLPAGRRGSDCYECLCNSRKAPELSTHAVVIALKSAGIFLQSLHARLLPLTASDVK